MIFTRQQLEELEDQNLAPYGVRSRNSKGRLFPEDPPNRITAPFSSETGTGFCTPPLFGGWNIKPRSSSIMKAIITAPA